MKHYRNVIICMDDTERDAPMLAYMVPFLQKAETKQVILLHVHDPETDPHTTSVIPQYDSMWEVPVTPSADMTEHTRDKMIALAKQNLSPIQGLEWRTVLSDQPEITEILSQAAALDADLIVIGRHYDDTRFKSSQAVTARRVTEKSTCSVLILPESAPPQISRVIVPVRNSECSAVALRTAHGISTAFEAEITALNVFKNGIKDDDPKHLQRRHHLEKVAETEILLLLQRTNISDSTVTSRIISCDGNDPVTIILDQMVRTRCDLVAIGARGRTGAAGVLLGAVTEELIQKSPVPVLAIKTKGECVDLLHALLSLVHH